MLTAIIIFAVTYLLIITEKVPNSIAAMLGAFFIIIFRIISEEEAIHYIDFSTIGLLTGMMMMIVILKKTGIFEYIAIKSLKKTKGSPTKILISISVITAILSALLDNVTTVLIIVPITFAIAETIRINPMPFLIAEILFSNIGGAATLIGDPPNIMIAGATTLTFTDFLTNNLPVVLIISFVTLYLLKIIYHKELIPNEGAEERISFFDEAKTIKDKKFLIKSIGVFGIVILGFITHELHAAEVATLALWGGFTMLLVTGIDPHEALRDVEWPTLFFFIGLFILVGALEHTHVILLLTNKLLVITHGAKTLLTILLLWISALSTTVLNSIPYTATMIPVIKTISSQTGIDSQPLWWALSLGACLGGNGTIIGASANIIVAGFANKNGNPISFKEFATIGFPLMILSIVIATIYIYIRYLV